MSLRLIWPKSKLIAFVSLKVHVTHAWWRDSVREDQTCKCSGHCQTTRDSCVTVSEAADQESLMWKDVAVTPWKNRDEGRRW